LKYAVANPTHLQLWHLFQEHQGPQVITPKSVLRHSQQRQVGLHRGKSSSRKQQQEADNISLLLGIIVKSERLDVLRHSQQSQVRQHRGDTEIR
jgi:hypothetical protein